MSFTVSPPEALTSVYSRSCVSGREEHERAQDRGDAARQVDRLGLLRHDDMTAMMAGDDARHDGPDGRQQAHHRNDEMIDALGLERVEQAPREVAARESADVRRVVHHAAAQEEGVGAHADGVRPRLVRGERLPERRP